MLRQLHTALLAVYMIDVSGSSPASPLLACRAQVLEQKKAALLAKYTSDSLLAQQAEARSLLNKR